MCLEDGTYTTYPSSTNRYVQLSSSNGDNDNNLATIECYYGTTTSNHPYQLEIARLAAKASQLHQQPHTFSLKDFLRHNPPKFSGKVNPYEAYHWVRDIYKIFEATQCLKERKLSYVIYIYLLKKLGFGG